jgi:uncharacterized RDD family membrane protein YckC
MVYDLQKASLLKRASAWILDMILLLVLVTGFATVISSALHFDSHTQVVAQRQAHYESQYGVKFEMTQEEYEKLTPEQKQITEEAYKAFAEDKEAIYHYNMIVNLSMVILSLSVLLGFLGLEFAVPLLFGNGQTVGKRVFGIAVMKQNGVKVNAVTMFVRTVLGKFTFEAMLPLLLLLMMLLGLIGIVGPGVILALLVAEIIIMITSRTNATIHDKLAQTVAVDMHSQLIFASEEELMAYKQRLHEEKVRNSPY